MPTISVVVPSYNHARFLDQTLGSVLGQSFADLELIVVDDASTDGSPERLASWAARDPRLRVICHEINQGISRTLNHGLALITGELVAFIDSDDWWHERKLERQMTIVRERPDVAVWTDGLMMGPNNRVEGSFVRMFNDDRFAPSGWLFPALLRGNLVTLQSVLIPRVHLTDLVFDERIPLLSDYPFLIDVSRRCEFAFVPEPLTHFRLHGANTTFTQRAGWDAEAGIVRDDILSRYGDVMSADDRTHFLRVVARFEAFARSSGEALA